MANENTMVKIDQFKGILNSQTIRAQVHNSMKENAGSFMSSMIDLYSGDTALQKCDPEKVALECVKAAALKLSLVKSLGFAYVVPYKNVPTFILNNSSNELEVVVEIDKGRYKKHLVYHPGEVHTAARLH